jgi:hypothetical protein
MVPLHHQCFIKQLSHCVVVDWSASTESSDKTVKEERNGWRNRGEKTEEMHCAREIPQYVPLSPYSSCEMTRAL